MSDLVHDLRHGRGLMEGRTRDAWLHGRVLAAADEIERLSEVERLLTDANTALGDANDALNRELAEAKALLKTARSALIYERPHALVISDIDAFLSATTAESAQ